MYVCMYVYVCIHTYVCIIWSSESYCNISQQPLLHRGLHVSHIGIAF